MKKIKGAAKIFRYIALTFVAVLGFIAIIGTGGGGGGGDSEPAGTAPTIDNVVLTDENFIPKSVFDIDDAVNFLVTATDPDRNMEELIIEQYYPSDSTGNPYYGPDSVALPSQAADTMTYYLLSAGAITEPSGYWRIEFLIVDSTELESNVFTVYALVN